MTSPSSRIPFRHSLKGRLLLGLALPILLISGGVMVLRWINTFALVREQARTSLRHLTDQIAAQVDRGNARAVMAAEIMAYTQEEALFGKRPESSALARRILDAFPEFTGAYFGYETNADNQDREYAGTPAAAGLGRAFAADGRFIPYWFRDEQAGGQITLTPLIDMETSLYYQGCKDQFLTNNRALPMVTEPYVYEGKMIMEQTFPIVRDGRFLGVAGVDRALKDIGLMLESIKASRGVDLFLISSRGKFIATTMPGLELRTKAIAETRYRELFGKLYDQRRNPGFEIAPDPVEGRRHYFASASVPTGDWLLVARVSEDSVLGPLWRNTYVSTVLAAAALVLVMAFTWWTARSVSHRIGAAMVAADRVAQGDLSQDLALRAG
jgi:methyl-accepting chemotaxis protein